MFFSKRAFSAPSSSSRCSGGNSILLLLMCFMFGYFLCSQRRWEDDRDIGRAEVAVEREHWQVLRFRQRVGEAVAEIQREAQAGRSSEFSLSTIGGDER